MMVGLLSGTAFAEANWNTGLERSPAFEHWTPPSVPMPVYHHESVSLAFCSGGSHIRIVPGTANANENSVVSVVTIEPFGDLTVVNPHRVQP